MSGNQDLQKFENLFESKMTEIGTSDDPAHDILHFRRVVKTAKALAETENANLEVVVPAAWLHDFVVVPKDDSRRKEASRLSAQAAMIYLRSLNYGEKHLEDIAHAIEAHSFSAKIEARTLEAKIVQDADRLDGLGAIGIARCFVTAGLMKTSLYSETDPFCRERIPQDQLFTVDHFFAKLFRIAESLQTKSGQFEGQRRVKAMEVFLKQLQSEI